MDKSKNDKKKLVLFICLLLCRKMLIAKLIKFFFNFIIEIIRNSSPYIVVKRLNKQTTNSKNLNKFMCN